MEINYWDCDHSDYDEISCGDDGDYYRHYGCSHCKGSGYCHLDNKFDGDKAECLLLKIEEERESE